MSITPLIVDLPTAASALGISISTFQQLVRSDKAPKPRQISANRVGWRWRELEAFAESLPESQILPPANTGAKKPRKKEAA